MLRLEKVNVYYGESHILRNVSFHIEAGQVACVMGRNGVGKSTTLKAIMGLLPVRSGQVSFDGADITKAPTDRRAKAGLAYVPQGREIIPHLTVRENLQLGYWARGNAGEWKFRKGRLRRGLSLFPKAHADSRAAGWGVERRGTAATGHRTRALSNPKVLLLDEPTEGIQPSIVDQIEDVIIGFKTARRFAIVLVEQGLHFAGADWPTVMS